jgi:glyoxylase-like metal-dependent hydrolase (beta-lactamase superfamily II)
MIIKKIVVGPLACNCYIVGAESTRKGIIIDPGDEATRILNEAKDLGVEIESIVLTHGHKDHVGALKETKEAIDAKVIIHTDETDILKDQSLARSFGLFYPDAPLPDTLLKDGDAVDVGGIPLSVLHTPGHTPGGICLLGEGFVFSGDTLFNQGIGRCDFPGGDYEQLLNSIRTKLMTLPDTTVVYPGHGPDTIIGTERTSNPFLQG